MRVEIDHLSPNRVGDEVRATARVVAVDRRRVRFEVEATSAGGVVGRGVVVRAVVDRVRTDVAPPRGGDDTVDMSGCSARLLDAVNTALDAADV